MLVKRLYAQKFQTPSDINFNNKELLFENYHTITLEGMRPLMIEIQSLGKHCSIWKPQRSTTVIMPRLKIMILEKGPVLGLPKDVFQTSLRQALMILLSI
jgi:predicted ATP-dependent serine protease